MGAAFCCKKPEEIVVEEYKNSENNGDIDKINAIDQDSYPKDTELVNKANIIYEEQEVSNQKLYEQEGSQKEDGAYEVPINSPSPSKNKQVEISEQNNNQTPENEDNQDEIQNINVNQYSQEELEMYQNQLRINKNLDNYQEEAGDNIPTDTPNKQIIEENDNLHHENQINEDNQINEENQINEDNQINEENQINQENQINNLEEQIHQINTNFNNIQVKDADADDDINKYFQLPTDLAKSKTTMQANTIQINDIQKLIEQNQKQEGNIASVTPIEENDDLNQYFINQPPVSPVEQTNDLDDKELHNEYYTTAITHDIKPEELTENNLNEIVNMKNLPETFGSSNIQQISIQHQPQTNTTTTVTKTTENIPINDTNNFKQTTTTTKTETIGNIPTTLTNSEIKKIVDMKDLPETIGSSTINNFQQKTITTTTHTTGNVDLTNIPTGLTSSTIQKIIDMKDLPATFGSSDIKNFKQTTTTTKTETIGNMPTNLTNSEIKKIIDMKDLPETIGSNTMKKTTVTTTTTTNPMDIVNMKDLPPTFGSNEIKNFKQTTTTTKTETRGNIPTTLTNSEINKILNMKDLPETIGSNTMKKTTVTTTTTTNQPKIDLSQFGLEQNPSISQLKSPPIDLKQFGLAPTSSAVSTNQSKKVTTVTKTVQKKGVIPSQNYSNYFQQHTQVASNPVDLKQFGLEKNASNISNILQGSNITFKQPEQSLKIPNYTQIKNITPAASTPIIPSNNINSYYKTTKTTTTTVKPSYGVVSSGVNPNINYGIKYPAGKTTTTTTTTKTTGIPITSASAATVNYTLPANYTTNKVTTSGVNQKYW